METLGQRKIGLQALIPLILLISLAGCGGQLFVGESGVPNADNDTTITANTQGPVDSNSPPDASTSSVSPSPSSSPTTGKTSVMMFNSSTIPAVDTDADSSAVELGMKFKSLLAGQVTGVRFYKGTANTGTHLGNLWDASGNKLATVTFTNETASGWQQANFSTPVSIQANMTYVVSYFAPQGHYAGDDGFFANGVTSTPLYAFADGENGANGLYHYGSSAFPTDTFASANYYVDAVVSVDSAALASLPSPSPVVTYSVEASANVNGAISPSGSVSVVSGTSKTFSITAAGGYKISSVMVDGASVGAVSTYTFSNVMMDHKISATFSALPVTLPTNGGNVYYVATTGKNTNAGTSAAPFLTLQYAADKAVNPGDTVIVRAGTYNVGMNIFGQKGGSSTAPISFLADPGVTITHSATEGSNASVAAINIESSGAYYIVQGFTVVGDGSMSKAGIRAALTDNVQILNNTVSKAFTGIFVSGSSNSVIQGNLSHDASDQHGIYVSANTSGTIIRNNTLYGNNWDGLHMNCTIGNPNLNATVEGNISYGNTDAGMDIEGISGATFRNNLIYSNSKHGITLHSQDQANTPGTQGNTFVNNTIIKNGMFGIQMQPADTAETIFNNIILSNGGSYGSIGVSGKPAGLVSDYNILIDDLSSTLGVGTITLAAWRSLTGQDAHSIIGNATNLFANANSDYHLKLGAIAIDAGLSSFNGKAAPLDDFDHNARPHGNGYDIGAFEFQN